MSEEWTSCYGDVVWAKYNSFPWWPCIVYDPAKLPSSSDRVVRDKARKLVGKQHVVYFFADKNYGFCLPKFIQPYSGETKEKHASETVSKKYQESFAQAIVMADEQSALPKQERLSWHYTASSKEDPPAEEEQSNDGDAGEVKQKKRGRPPKVKSTTPRNSNDLYFQDTGYNEGNDGDGSVALDEEEEVVGEPESEEDVESESDATEDDEPEEKKPRGLKRRSTFGASASACSGSGSAKKRGRPPARSQSAPRGAVLKVSVASAVSAMAQRPKPDEPLLDRLTRLSSILTVCAAEGGTCDLDRAARVLDKLSTVEPTGAELIKSGIGKVVAGLRKHSSAGISEKATALRNRWADIVLQQQNRPLAVTEPTQLLISAASASKVNTGSVVGSTKEGQAAQDQSPQLHAASAVHGQPNGQGQGQGQGQGLVRARAVRLLREASAQCSVPGINSGELAFALEKAAMEAFGAGQPRYFEFLSRITCKFKQSDAHLTSTAEQVRDGQTRNVLNTTFDLISAV